MYYSDPERRNVAEVLHNDYENKEVTVKWVIKDGLLCNLVESIFYCEFKQLNRKIIEVQTDDY